MNKPVENIQLREFRQLEWHSSRQALIDLRYIETHLLSDDMDIKERRLRTNHLKKLREGRDAALFAYGLEDQVLKVPTWISIEEKSDYDFVVKWVKDDAEYYYPVQLKELPPDDINPKVTLEHIYDKLEKYQGAHNISVAININRKMKLNWGPWSREKKPNICELWLFGCKSEDQSLWYLAGDILKKRPRFHEYSYPEGEPTRLPNNAI